MARRISRERIRRDAVQSLAFWRGKGQPLCRRTQIYWRSHTDFEIFDEIGDARMCMQIRSVQDVAQHIPQSRRKPLSRAV